VLRFSDGSVRRARVQHSSSNQSDQPLTLPFEVETQFATDPLEALRSRGFRVSGVLLVHRSE